jgi:formylglycine-generating enzyme required for sulfatase activity
MKRSVGRRNSADFWQVSSKHKTLWKSKERDMEKHCTGCGKESKENKTRSTRYRGAAAFIALVLVIVGLWFIPGLRKDFTSRPADTSIPTSNHTLIPAPAAPASKDPALLPMQKKNPRDGAAMVLIPAGEFLMGSPEYNGNSSAKPQHRVYLDAYYMYKYEVTNGQFREFVHESGYDAEGSWRDYAVVGMDSHPVVCVTWNDAKAYCEWAGGALPTEAQWEKAARGVDGRIWPWGNTFSGKEFNWGNGPKVKGRADIYKGRGTAPVGSYPKDVSPYGVHDMAGNVGEWCNDWLGRGYYLESPSKNPAGPILGQLRVIRAGNWYITQPEICLCASREGDIPGRWLNFLGFRACLAATAP